MLRQDEIDRFHRDGFLRIPALIAGRELALLREAADRVVAEGVARAGADHLYEEGDEGRGTYRRSEAMWRRDPIFRAVTVNPALLEAIGQCIGHAFYPWNDSLVVKLPGGGPIGWHQDPPYGDPARSRTYVVPNFTTDIYLDDADEDNGCVWAVPGHHLVGHVSLADKDAETIMRRCGAVPVRMRAGDVLFHALSTPHGSLANRSTRTRRTFYVHYLTQEVQDECGYRWGKPGWGEGKRAQIATMAADRGALGLGDAFGPRIVEQEEGLRFVGAPCTPLRHWRGLADAIPSERRAAMKALKPAVEAAAVA